MIKFKFVHARDNRKGTYGSIVPTNRRLLAAGLFLAACPVFCGGEPLMPTEHFFRIPLVDQVSISPDGQFIAYIGYEKGRKILVTRNLETGKKARIFGGPGRDISNYHWADDENLVYSVSIQRYWAYGLYSVHRKGTPLRTLVEGEHAEVLNPHDGPDPEVLVQIRPSPEKKPHVHRLDYLFDTSGGESTGWTPFLEERNPGWFDIWVTDQEGRIRLGLGFKDGEYGDGQPDTFYREADDEPWRQLPLPHDATPAAFEYGGDILYVGSNHDRNTLAYYRYDFERKELEEPLFADREYDVTFGYLFFSRRQKRLVGVTYERERAVSIWLDPFYEGLQERIDGALPGTINQIIDDARDEHRFLVRSYSDRQPPVYSLFEPESGHVSQILESMPWIDAETMASMQAVSFEARDGMKLHGYVTLPPGRTAGSHPMVVIPHGGPQSRDVWGFQPLVQFLASRGYLVLQVNYRGSIGYGRKLKEAIRHEFGRKLQNDITDAVQEMVSSDLVDPSRIAIYGVSFGGYLALCGAALTPHLFRCAVASAGVFDWSAQLKKERDDRYLHPDYGYEFLSYWLADPETDPEAIRAASPIYYVDRIRAPILVIHGKSDPIVARGQARIMIRALKKAGKPCQAYLKSWEGHGFQGEKNRIKLYRKIEEFLEENLH